MAMAAAAGAGGGSYGGRGYASGPGGVGSSGGTWVQPAPPPSTPAARVGPTAPWMVAKELADAAAARDRVATSSSGGSGSGFMITWRGRLRVVPDAPVTLAYVAAATLVLLWTTTTSALSGAAAGAAIARALAVVPFRYWSSPVDAYRLLTYVFAHVDGAHYMGNITSILLLGPALEARWGAATLAGVAATSTVATGLINAAALGTGLVGSSGLVMTLLLLSAATATAWRGGDAGVAEVPLSFVALVALHAGRELVSAFTDDGVSRLAHLVGMACGFLWLPAAVRWQASRRPPPQHRD